VHTQSLLIRKTYSTTKLKHVEHIYIFISGNYNFSQSFIAFAKYTMTIETTSKVRIAYTENSCDRRHLKVLICHVNIYNVHPLLLVYLRIDWSPLLSSIRCT